METCNVKFTVLQSKINVSLLDTKWIKNGSPIQTRILLHRGDSFNNKIKKKRNIN